MNEIANTLLRTSAGLFAPLLLVVTGSLLLMCAGVATNEAPPAPDTGTKFQAETEARIHAAKQVPSPVGVSVVTYDAKQNASGEWLVSGHIDHHPPNLHAPIRDEFVIKLTNDGKVWTCVDSTLRYQYPRPGAQ